MSIKTFDGDEDVVPYRSRSRGGIGAAAALHLEPAAEGVPELCLIDTDASIQIFGKIEHHVGDRRSRWRDVRGKMQIGSEQAPPIRGGDQVFGRAMELKAGD